jgi:predicted Fe-Mo cluster-binding NifX family protein
MEYKIAVTTSTGDTVDVHFGQADNFSIYTVDSESGKYTLSEKRVIDKTYIPEKMLPNHECSCNDARAEYIAKLLADCTYVVTGKIGNRQYSNLLRYGISALETPYPLEFAVKKLNDYKKKQQKNSLCGKVCGC